jgi:putative ABC transport system permease protein
MRDAFVDAHTACGGSRTRLLRLWARTAVDLTWSGIKERRYSTQPSGTARESTRGWSGTGFSLLDLKLGLRMLLKHPGLTIVTMFALAIGIPVGLTPTHLANAAEAPLPVPDGNEIRLLRYWNQARGTSAATTFYDFLQWRDGLTTFESLGAVRTSAYNLDSNDGLAPPVQGAEVTGSTFDVLRVAPFLGRTLAAADDVRGAPSVAIIGYDLWQSRLAGDPKIIGRDVRIGGVPHTIVGVMPKGFLFPVRHQLWLPLRDSPTVEPREGAPLTVFGRLRGPDAEDAAQAELTTVGSRMALAFPQAQEWLQPEVVPFSYIAVGGAPKGGIKALPEFYVSQILTIFLLMVACANVGMLIFARTAARSGELAVRTALGASRSRIISQVFTESLVKLILGRGVGITLIGFVVGVAVATALARALQGLLFQVSPADPLVIRLSASLLFTTATLAAWLPARRASRVDAAISLRY